MLKSTGKSVHINQLHVIPTLLFLVLVTSSPSLAALESLPEEHPAYRLAQAVYERLLPAFGEGRMAPRLLVIPKGTRSREAVASSAGGNEGSLAFEAGSGLLSEGYVAIEERTIEALSDLGKERDDALAFLLAHELAHVYLRHGWAEDFGNSFARTDMGRKMIKAATFDDVIRREAEADHFGGFYGYLAGFDTLGVAPRALERIYASFALPDQLPNYPSKSERIAIARRQKESLDKLVPVYTAANRLLILGRYGEAGRLFSHLARLFPSREMFNNAGVSFALEAVRLLPPDSAPFVYPFELDAETRLQNQGQCTPRSGQEDDQSTHRKRLLRRALALFDQAARLDVRYVTARVNSAAAQSLLGEQDQAVRQAEAALCLAREENERIAAGLALVMRGIALARTGDTLRARSDLEAARAVVPELATANIAAMEGRGTPLQALAANETAGRVETIAGYPALKAFSGSGDRISVSLSPAEKRDPAIAIQSRHGADWESTLIALGKHRVGTLATGRTYQGASARGVRIGSPLSSLGQLYGAADRIVPSRQGSYYIYNATGIAFEVDSLGKVCGWFLFALR
jgi:tetratricopeptide (TPR) repeat protein